MLVTPDELAKYMDKPFSVKQKEAVTFILEGLQGELEAFLGRPIEVRSFTENYYVRPEWDDWVGPFSNHTDSYPVPYGAYAIPLKNSPVVAITSVYFSGVGSASVTPILQIPNQDYVLRPFGLDLLYGLTTMETVTVVYTAGMNGAVYPVFKHKILQAAAREAQNLTDDNRGIQSMEAREAAPALPTGFSEQELASLKRYRRQRI